MATIVRLRFAVWLVLPDVAVRVTFEVPDRVELPAVNVPRNRAEPFRALKDAVTPAGSPVADSTMVPGVPVAVIMEMAVAPWPPWTTLKLAGTSAMVKFAGGAAVTVTVTVTAAERAPEVPLTVNWVALSAAVLAAVRVSVLVAVVLAGLNDAVTPVGRLAVIKATDPLKPPAELTVMLAVPVLPVTTLIFETEEASVKLGAGVTLKGRVAVAETLPDVAVMVNEAVVTGAELLAVSVSLLVVVALAGLKAAVTPLGNPEMVRLTAPVKPLTGVTVMVLVPDVPCVMLRLAGAAASVTAGAPFTVRLTVTEVDALPNVPVTVTVAVPTVAVDAAVKVTVLVVAVLAGLNEAVTPLGSPDAVRVTLPLNPLLGVTVMVSVPLAPAVTLSMAAEAAIEKLAGAATVRVIPTVALRLPDLPVSVTVVVPKAALALAVKLNVLAVAVLAGLNNAVTPLGSPETVRLTALLNPFAGATVMLAVPVAPSTMVNAAGVVCRLKLAAAVTCRLRAVASVRVPETPLTDRAYVPGAAPLAAVRVNWLALALTAPNVPVTPLGSPDTLRVTAPEKPFCGVI